MEGLKFTPLVSMYVGRGRLDVGGQVRVPVSLVSMSVGRKEGWVECGGQVRVLGYMYHWYLCLCGGGTVVSTPGRLWLVERLFYCPPLWYKNSAQFHQHIPHFKQN